MYISIQQYKDNVVTLTLTGRILQSMHRFEDLSDCIHVHEIPTSQKKHTPKQNQKNPNQQTRGPLATSLTWETSSNQEIHDYAISLNW